MKKITLTLLVLLILSLPILLVRGQLMPISNGRLLSELDGNGQNIVDVANFEMSGGITIDNVSPSIYLDDSTAIAEDWWINNLNGVLRFLVDDDGDVFTSRFEIDESGNVQADGLADFDGTGESDFAGDLRVNGGELYVDNIWPDGATQMDIGFDSSDYLSIRDSVAYWSVGTTWEMTFNTSGFQPYANNGYRLGASGNRWEYVYATYGNFADDITTSAEIVSNGTGTNTFAGPIKVSMGSGDGIWTDGTSNMYWRLDRSGIARRAEILFQNGGTNYFAMGLSDDDEDGAYSGRQFFIGTGTGFATAVWDMNTGGDTRQDGDATIEGNVVTSGTSNYLSNHKFTGNAFEMGDGYVSAQTIYQDFHADEGGTYTDYALRLIRNSGANGTAQLSQRGTGSLLIYTQDHAPIDIYTNSDLVYRFDEDHYLYGYDSGAGTNYWRNRHDDTHMYMYTSKGDMVFQPWSGIFRVYGAQTGVDEQLEVGKNDTDIGYVEMFGHSTGSAEGGEARFYAAADHDGFIDYTFIDAYEDDLRFRNSDRGFMELQDNAGTDPDITTSVRLFFQDNDIYFGVNGGGENYFNFYDDNSNTWRTLKWDDTANQWEMEGNAGSYWMVHHDGNYPSSIRYKENVKPIAGILDKINDLAGVRFTWKDHPSHTEKAGTDDIGVIAERIEKHFPELVIYGDNGEINGVRYDRLSIIALAGLAEANEKIEKLEGKINEKSQNNDWILFILGVVFALIAWAIAYGVRAKS